jgi:hypothetical protein
MRKITTIFLISLFFLGFIFAALPTGRSATYTLVGWESSEGTGFNGGSTSGNNAYMTFERYFDTGGFYIANFDDYLTGTQSLQFDDTADEAYGWINLSNNYTYIQSITFIVNWTHTTTGNNHLSFYVKDDDFTVLEFHYSSLHDAVRYNDVVTGWQTICSIPDGKAYSLKFVITHVSGNTMNYSVYDYDNSDAFLGGVDGYTYATSDWTNFRRLLILKDATAALNDEWFLDDIIIDTTPTEGEDPGAEEGYEYIGGEDYSYYISSNANTMLGNVETQYHVPMSADFHVFDLYFENHALFTVLNASATVRQTITACLNGNSMGSVDEVSFIGWTTPPESISFMRWEFDAITLSEQMPVIEVHFPQALLASADVRLWTSPPGVDIDGDGIALLVTHFSDPYVCNAELQGVPYDRDLVYKLYYDNVVLPEVDPHSTIDHISVHNYIGSEHPTHGIPYYNALGHVVIAYSIASLVPDTQIRIYHEGTEVGQEQNYPIDLFEHGRSYGYVPPLPGFYNASLYRGAIRILNASFYVQDNTEDYWIWSYPNPSVNRNRYTVGYKYYNPNGYDGKLACFSSLTDLNSGIYAASQVYELTSNTTQNLSHPPTTQQQYWQIYVYKNYQHIRVGGVHLHICLSSFYENGRIYAVHPIVRYDEHIISGPIEDAPAGYTQTLWGFHSYLFAQARISINDYPRFDVSEEQNFSLEFFPESTGQKIAKLEVRVNSTWIELDRVTYNVSDYSDIFDTGEGEGFFPDIDSELKVIVGTILVIVCTCIPLFISLGFGTAPFDIPPIVYAMCGSAGVVFAVYLDLFDMWVPFFFVIVGAIVIVLDWLRNR